MNGLDTDGHVNMLFTALASPRRP